MLQREAAAQLPSNWCTFAQNCVMQLRDLEDAMQVGSRLPHVLNTCGRCLNAPQVLCFAGMQQQHLAFVVWQTALADSILLDAGVTLVVQR